MAKADGQERVAAQDQDDTLQWIKDWREGMFSSTSRDEHGWPIEMHGLAASYEALADECERLRAGLERMRAWPKRDEHRQVLSISHGLLADYIEDVLEPKA